MPYLYLSMAETKQSVLKGFISDVFSAVFAGLLLLLLAQWAPVKCLIKSVLEPNLKLVELVGTVRANDGQQSEVERAKISALDYPSLNPCRSDVDGGFIFQVKVPEETKIILVRIEKSGYEPYEYPWSVGESESADILLKRNDF